MCLWLGLLQLTLLPIYTSGMRESWDFHLRVWDCLPASGGVNSVQGRVSLLMAFAPAANTALRGCHFRLEKRITLHGNVGCAMR